MYCRPCAERFFSKAMVCPVCDVRTAWVARPCLQALCLLARYAARAVTPGRPPQHSTTRAPLPSAQCDVDGDFGIIELCHDNSNDTMTAVFGYMSLFPHDALSILAEAIKFTRYQVSLYGACVQAAVCVRAPSCHSPRSPSWPAHPCRHPRGVCARA